MQDIENRKKKAEELKCLYESIETRDLVLDKSGILLKYINSFLDTPLESWFLEACEEMKKKDEEIEILSKRLAEMTDKIRQNL